MRSVRTITITILTPAITRFLKLIPLLFFSLIQFEVFNALIKLILKRYYFMRQFFILIISYLMLML